MCCFVCFYMIQFGTVFFKGDKDVFKFCYVLFLIKIIKFIIDYYFMRISLSHKTSTNQTTKELVRVIIVK